VRTAAHHPSNLLRPARSALALLVLVLAGAAPACERPHIEVIVPFPAGGSLDGVVRIVADGATRATGRSFVVRNLGGGSGTIGSQQVLRRKADGCTLLAGTINTLVLAPRGQATAPYSHADFVPVGLLGHTDYLLLAHPGVAASNLQQLAAAGAARAQPFSFGHPGVDSVQYLGLALVARQTGLALLPVPYKGAAPMLGDLAGGHIELAVVARPAAAAAIERGLVKELANISQWSRESTPADPPVPSWAGWFVPERTAPQQLQWLREAMESALSHPEVVRQLQAISAPPADMHERRAFIAHYRRDAHRVAREAPR